MNLYHKISNLISRITLVGTANNDTLNATSATTAYNLYGYAGNDVLNGNAKDDSLMGGDGNDTLNGNTGNDTLNGEAGNDSLDGGAGSDNLQAGDGNNTLSGGLGNDVLTAGIGNNILNGNEGDDTLNANQGNDTLVGGLGNDNINGDLGNDTVVYENTLLSQAVIDSTTITTPTEGTDWLTSIEIMQFKDRTLSVVDYFRETYGEFRVNTTTASEQTQSSITTLADGSFVVTWSSNNDIYAQHFDANAKEIGSEFLVNTYTNDNQANSTVAALNDGSYLVTWDSNNQDGSKQGIYGQRYSADDKTMGSEFLVNKNNTTDNQQNSSITYLDTGGFVTTWQSYDAKNANWDINAQRYSADGSTIGNKFVVNSYAEHNSYVVTDDLQGFQLKIVTKYYELYIEDRVTVFV